MAWPPLPSSVIHVNHSCELVHEALPRSHRDSALSHLHQMGLAKGKKGGQEQTVFNTQPLEVFWRARGLVPEGFGESLVFPHPCRRGGVPSIASLGWPRFHLWTVLLVSRGQGEPLAQCSRFMWGNVWYVWHLGVYFPGCS